MIAENAKGFTLVEILVALTIAGILAALVSTGIANIIQGYLFTRDNAGTALKAQVALTRLSRELRSLDDVTSGTRTRLVFDYNKEGTQVSGRTIFWNGQPGSSLLLDGNTLIDQVSDFIITYHTGYADPGDNLWHGGETIISITLAISGAENTVSTFSTRVAPRNL